MRIRAEPPAQRRAFQGDDLPRYFVCVLSIAANRDSTPRCDGQHENGRNEPIDDRIAYSFFAMWASCSMGFCVFQMIVSI